MSPRENMQDLSQHDDLLMELVDLALAKPPAERESCLREACSGDAELFRQAWQYVEWDERMQGFLMEPLYQPLGVEHPFTEGDVLDCRFRIEREIAQGSMGVVYQAWDEKLERRIAIKFAKTGYRKRLPPEVRHAREITHHNVCKIFEIHTARTSSGDVDFVTMEYVEGETLAERLKRGALPQAEVRLIARQLCAGLSAAHAHGVIHGDLKCQNVILSKASDGSVRAVITDFGIARQKESPQGTAQTGPRGGTPDYMAPELWNGEKASIASDVYALGVILYELASGRRPHGPEVTWEERLTRKPPALHSKWDRILACCLDPDPARRFRSADEVAQAIAPSHSRRWFVGTATAAAVLAVLTVVTFERTTGPAELIKLAILPFDTDAADKPLTDGLLEGTAEQLRNLKGSPIHRLTVIPLADAVRKKVDSREKATGLLGATHMLTGSLRREGSRAQIHAYLTDTRSGLPLKEWQAEYQFAELPTLPVALAGMVTGTLRLPPLVKITTVNGAAYADFIRGVGLLQFDKADEALPLLERAARADPSSPLTHARLAQAQHLKYEFIKDMNGSGGDEWQQQARTSLERAERIDPDLALVRAVSGIINEYVGLYERAEADFRRALEIEPQNGDVWRRLGDLYQKVSRFPEAVAAYQKALETQPGYFKNYQALCSLYADQANYDEAIPNCQKLVGLVPQLSEAHFDLAKPYVTAGRFAEGEHELRTALDLDPTNSRALHALAQVMVYQGRYTEAIPVFTRAIEIGPETEVLYLNLGTTFRLAGLVEDAQRAYTKAFALAEAELSKNLRNRTVRSHLAYLCARLGQRSRAEFEVKQALQVSSGSVEVARVIVQTYEALGERDRALALAATLPDETLKRLNRSPDSADLPKDLRFQELMQSRHIH
jgi:tetratricopeptide (TPR) repeat protein/TolB-like protein